MSKNIYFIFLWIFYLLWIFINNIISKLNTSLLVLLFLVVLFLLLYIKVRKYGILFTIIIISFLIWILISNINYNIINDKIKLINTFKEKNEFLIEIINLSKESDKNKIYNAKLLEINGKKIKKKIKLEAILQWNYEIKNWDILRYESKVLFFEGFNWFNYEKYMLSRNVYFKNVVYNYEIIWHNKKNIIIEKINSIRKNLIEKIKIIYTSEESLFLSWILLWARENIPKDLSDNFNNSWLTHIIAVSGFNITIIVIFIWLMVKYLPWYLKVVIMTLSIIFFTILVWYSAPVIRAAIMWIIGYLVINSWRKWDILSVLILTLIIMVSFSPLSINFDVSLHLSFLAVLWIIYSQKFFEKLFNFIPNIFEIRNAISLTFAAMTFTLPIMIFNFWQLSIIAPISNILVMWTIPLAMLFWFLSIIIYDLNYIFSIIIWYFAWILLKWDILVVNTLWEYKYAVIKYDFWEYKYIFEIIYFILTTFIILWIRKRDEN